MNDHADNIWMAIKMDYEYILSINLLSRLLIYIILFCIILFMHLILICFIHRIIVG